MHYSIFSALLLCATSTVILFGATANAEFHCQPDEWWNASGICVTCTRCPELVLRTCQPHKDTVCGGFEDIEINLIQVSARKEEKENPMYHQNSWEWFEISLLVAAITSVFFVFAALYLAYAHRRQWNKMQQLDEELEQDISRLMGKLAEVPNIQKTTAVLVDEHQIKKGGQSFRWIYLDQLLGKSQRKSPKCGNVYTQNGATDRNFVV